jgi:hypothetical protein
VLGGNKIEIYKIVSETGRCIRQQDRIISIGLDISGIELSDSATISLGICVGNLESVTIEAEFLFVARA